MTNTGQVLGFDLRLTAASMNQYWEGGQRELYLLKPGIAWPASVDTSVWPSIFCDPRPIEGAAGQPLTVPRQSELAQNLAEMRDALQVVVSREESAVPIAVVFLEERPLADIDEAPLSMILEQRTPASVPVDWRPMGYDVADAGLVSGLSGCGYDDETAPLMREHWATKLNEFGLFDCLGDAVAFRAVSDDRVEEHAPFFLFQLFCAPELWVLERCPMG